MGDLERQAPDRRHALGDQQLLLRGLEPGERARELDVQPLHLVAGAALALGDEAERHRRQAEERREEEGGRPAGPRRDEPRRERVEPARDDGRAQSHPRAEVVGVDRDQREEQEVVEAVGATREREEREDDEQVDRERPHEDRPRGARVHRDEGEDAHLVGREPEDEPVEVDPVARAQRDETEGGETADHHDGEEDREDPLVALEQPKDRVPGLPFA